MATSPEKTAAEHVDYSDGDNKDEKPRSGETDLEKKAMAASEEEGIVEYDVHETRKILRKIDYRLVPFLSVLYLASFLDRSNLANAEIAGMEEDLNLQGQDYNVALTVFFVSYALLEVPSNIILKLMRPSHWVAIMMFGWGLVMTLMGIVKSYRGLVVDRFFLGVAEAGLFPAASYLLTLWYQRYEIQKRIAVFYTAVSLAGAFSGLLAYAIEKMQGIAGLNGWQWIFIIEGLYLVVCAVFVWFLLPDQPETASFLTQPERDFVIHRLSTETGSGAGKVTNSDRIQWRHIKDAFLEWKVWLAMIIYSAVSISIYGFTSTVPIVVEQLGYSSANAQLMTIPVYIAAMIGVLVFVFWSDYLRERSMFILAGSLIASIGFIGQLAIPHTRLEGVTYFFLFPIAVGLYSPYVCIVCLVANNLAPSSKRAVGMALLVTVGNLGGICGSNIFLSKQAPKYPVGFGVCLGVLVCSITATVVMRHFLKRENQRRDEFMAGRSPEEVTAQYTEEELLNLGDRSPFFRYTL